MPKDNVLMLTSSFPRWPSDTDPPFVYQLAERLSDDFDITVLAPHCHGARRYERMGNLRVVRFQYFLEKYQKLAYQGGIPSNLKQNRLLLFQIPFFFLFELIALIRLVKRVKPQLVHAHWLLPQGLVTLIGCRVVKTRPKVVCTAHGADVYGLKDLFSNWLKRSVVRNTDLIAAVSTAMKYDIARRTGKFGTVEVIPMGVDLTNRFTDAGQRRHPHQLLFVGRLVAKKGLPYLLEAMPQICRRFPDASLLIIGDGHDRQWFEKHNRESGLDNYVKFLGPLPNHQLAAYYRRADLLVFPSIVDDDGDREGLGLVLIEAMGCGCGVIATDLPAVQDVIRNGINGHIIPQRSAKAIADAVVYLFENRSIFEEMRRRGLQTVREKFDWSVIAEKYRHVYRKLIAQPNP